jgi:hypothetical protein
MCTYIYIGIVSERLRYCVEHLSLKMDRVLAEEETCTADKGKSAKSEYVSGLEADNESESKRERERESESKRERDSVRVRERERERERGREREMTHQPQAHSLY